MIDVKKTFKISKYGFLPDENNKKLSDEFSFLQPALVVIHTENYNMFRDIINEIDSTIYTIPKIENLTYNEIINIYSSVQLLICKYKYKNNNKSKLPNILNNIAKKTSKIISMNNQLTYTSLCLYNWTLRHKNRPITIDNIKSKYLLVGNNTENLLYSHFVNMEYYSSIFIDMTIMLYKSNENNILNDQIMSRCINNLQILLTNIYNVIGKMDNSLDYSILSREIQPYLNNEFNIMHSPLLLSIDCFFGNDINNKLLKCITVKHRNYIHWVQKKINMKEFIIKIHDKNIEHAYNECITKYNDIKRLLKVICKKGNLNSNYINQSTKIYIDNYIGHKILNYIYISMCYVIILTIILYCVYFFY
jgi:hypothetical protein